MITKSRKPILFLLSLLLMVALFGCIYVVWSVNANVDTDTLKAEYVLGETVIIPDKTIQGINADKIIYLPSGTALKKDSIELQEAGKYTVEYRVVKGEEIFTEEIEFVAVRTLYTFNGKKSTAEYGLDNSQYNSGRTGLNVRLASGEKLTFEKVFNINELNGEFLKFYLTPEKRGSREVQGCWIYITDVADPDNYLKIKIQSVTYNGQPYVYVASYVLAAHNGEIVGGIDGDNGSYHRNDRFGTLGKLSFYGNGTDYVDVSGLWGVDDSEAYLRFIYDDNTKKLFLSDSQVDSLARPPKLITDFDDSAYFENLWSGFTTDDVRISVEAYGYTGAYFHINFLSVGDIDFSLNKIKDDAAPVITVDFDGYEENSLPAGVVGRSYRVFRASSYDEYDGIIEPTVKVYYAKGSSSMQSIYVKDGKFDTNYIGTYSIVYTVTDKSGNSSEKILNIYAGNPESDISLSLKDGYVQVCKVGNQIPLAIPVLTGGIGKTEISVEIDKKNIFDETANVIVPLETGVFTITYTATDYVGQEERISYTITVSDNDVPVVLDNVSLPKYVFAGLKTVFPTVIAFDFNEGTPKKAELYIDNVKYESYEYTPTRDLIGTSASIEYKVGDSVVYPNKAEDTSSIKVLDVRSSNDEVIWLNYFAVDDGDLTTSIDSEKVIIDVNGNGTVDFVKSVLFADTFSTTVSFDDEKSNFNRLNITITNADDFSEKFVIGLVKNSSNSSTDVYLNGEQTVFSITTGGFFSSALLKFTYENGKIINSANAVRLDISDFDAEKVYVSYSFENVKGNSVVGINEVCGQKFYKDVNNKYDLSAPQFKLFGTYDGIYNINQEITVLRVSVCDILDSYSLATVTVTGPDGKTIIKDKNAEEVWSITLNMYGKYKISYFLCDGSYDGTQYTKTNGATYDYYLNCRNDVKPEINLQSELKEVFKIGQTVVVPTVGGDYDKNNKIVLPVATATDDIDGTVEVSYFIATPAGELILLNQDRAEYTFVKCGNYALRVYASDSSGNISIKDVLFKVEK